MKDDHMQNGQLKPGYNVQFAVESEYVIGAGLFPDANDMWTLKPMLENMYAFNPTMEIKRLIVDSGYESEENYIYIGSRKIEKRLQIRNNSLRVRKLRRLPFQRKMYQSHGQPPNAGFKKFHSQTRRINGKRYE